MSAQALLALEDHPADFQTGFELGWDYARFRVTPPPAQLLDGNPVRQGWQAGQTAFGSRTREATRWARKWLQLRLNAWLRNRAFDRDLVTPRYLERLDVSHCPITRAALTAATGEPTDASIDRVFNDAGYATGNLAVISTRANHAKSDYGWRDAMGFVNQIEAGLLGVIDGLTAAEWSRVAVLCSFVTRMTHEESLALPLLVLPPKHLRLFNSVQGFQALVTQQLARPGYCDRLERIGRLIPGKEPRRDFRIFVSTLVPRLIEAGKPTDALPRRWALEDAWRNVLVNRCWRRFARQLTAAQFDKLLKQAKPLAGDCQFAIVDDASATEGWALETRGYAEPANPASHAPAKARISAHPLPLPGVRQASFDWVAAH